MDGDDNGVIEGFIFFYGLFSFCSLFLFGIISFLFLDFGILVWGMLLKFDNFIVLMLKLKEIDYFVVWEYFFNFYEFIRWYIDIV